MCVCVCVHACVCVCACAHCKHLNSIATGIMTISFMVNGPGMYIHLAWFEMFLCSNHNVSNGWVTKSLSEATTFW